MKEVYPAECKPKKVDKPKNYKVADLEAIKDSDLKDKVKK